MIPSILHYRNNLLAERKLNFIGFEVVGNLIIHLDLITESFNYQILQACESMNHHDCIYD